jgi:hypothetical protein
VSDSVKDDDSDSNCWVIQNDIKITKIIKLRRMRWTRPLANNREPIITCQYNCKGWNRFSRLIIGSKGGVVYKLQWAFGLHKS